MSDYLKNLEANTLQIRRAWGSANPKESNPAWLNAHRDQFHLFNHIDELKKIIKDQQEEIAAAAAVRQGAPTAPAEFSEDERAFLRERGINPDALVRVGTLPEQRIKVVDRNVEAVREMLLNRSEVGIKKYGVTTCQADLQLRDWLQHALEEALDMAVYLRAAISKLGELENGM